MAEHAVSWHIWPKQGLVEPSRHPGARELLEARDRGLQGQAGGWSLGAATLRFVARGASNGLETSENP